MDTRKVASEYRLSQWSQAIQDKAASGESIEEFCQNRGISRNTYFYWQRKLWEAACQKLATINTQGSVPSGWAVCESAKAGSAGNAIIIEVGNCRVVAQADVSAEHLEKVCRVLMRL